MYILYITWEAVPSHILGDRRCGQGYSWLVGTVLFEPLEEEDYESCSFTGVSIHINFTILSTSLYLLGTREHKRLARFGGNRVLL